MHLNNRPTNKPTLLLHKIIGLTNNHYTIALILEYNIKCISFYSSLQLQQLYIQRKQSHLNNQRRVYVTRYCYKNNFLVLIFFFFSIQTSFRHNFGKKKVLEQKYNSCYKILCNQNTLV